MHRPLIRRLLTLAASLVVTASTLAMSASPASATGGYNAENCRPGPGQQNPVVLAHGLGGNANTNWAYHGPQLAKAGYCVYSFTYGEGALGSLVGGLGPMRVSAAELKDFVGEVRERTGARQVDIVGHSAGTTITAYYLKYLGGAEDVESFVGFGSNYEGTSLSGLRTLALAGLGLPVLGDFITQQCASCREFLPPSDFLDELNAGGVSVPGVRYTNIVSRYDRIVTPYTSGVIDEPGVRNIVLQEACRGDLAGHLSMAIDPNVTSLIAANLAEDGPAVRCRPFLIPG